MAAPAVGHVTCMTHATTEPPPDPTTGPAPAVGAPAPDAVPVPAAEPPVDPVPGRDPATLPLDAAIDVEPGGAAEGPATDGEGS